MVEAYHGEPVVLDGLDEVLVGPRQTSPKLLPRLAVFGPTVKHVVADQKALCQRIVDYILEHHGRKFAYMQERMSPTANRIRTAPLWGLRTRSRLMHDGLSLTVRDAIHRHRGEANDARRRFEALGDPEQQELLTFMQSL